MRYLILIAGLALAGSALAEDATTSAAKELDKSSPSLMAPGDVTSGKSTGRRQHAAPAPSPGSHNASRSNRSSLRDAPGGDLDRDGRPDVLTCSPGVDDDCDDTDRVASPANHNTTRSNRTRAQDYNSSRSNTTSARLDPDSDDDSVLEEVRCSMASDDCVTTADDGNDLTLRKRPGKK